jgi:cyclopropane fatty-acyl-phospholipid synthase-like methyltransferase
MDAKQLYTERVDSYTSFSSFFRSFQALRAFFEARHDLRPGLRLLDAGCGTGSAGLALLQALRRRGFGYQCLHAFDLTPAMLERFRQHANERRIARVEIREANVVELDTLPCSWTDYDLIVSSAMLEYVPREKFAEALAALRARLAEHGRLFLIITRKNWITKLLIERWWRANRYTRAELEAAFAAAGFRNITFRRFPLSYFWHNQWAYVVEGRRT